MEVNTRDYDGSKTAVIQRRVPTQSEFELIREGALAVHVLEMPDDLNNLDFLLPVADVIRDLTVTDLACIDARAVEGMPNLEQLTLWIDAHSEAELGGLSALVSFAGRWKGARSVVDSLTLRQLFLAAPDPGALPALRSSLAELTLTSARRLNAVPRIDSSPDLEKLTIHGAKVLDLAPLYLYRRLRHLHLESCQLLSNAATLLTLPLLETVYLEKCPEIEGWESLETLRSANIRVVDKNPFDAEFRAAVAQHGTWEFPPSKAYLPRGRRSAASIRPDDNGD